MKPLLISSGEPAGIGPDLCILLAEYAIDNLVILADLNLLSTRAKLLNKNIVLHEYKEDMPIINSKNHLTVLHIPCKTQVIPQKCDINNVEYVLNILKLGTKLCLEKKFSAIVTAPIHKGIINDAGISFTGHTEFFEELCAKKSVMLLTSKIFNMAFVTTHLALKNVSAAITIENICTNTQIAIDGLIQDFAIKNPKIYISGLNPHAGEGGHMGCEEITIITPAINKLKSQGYNVEGPLSADTLFTIKPKAHLYMMMYHDQGLPVLKYASFGEACNVTLGLPIVRTSVDHGTALSLAGTGNISATSLLEAIMVAKKIVINRESNHAN